MPPVHNPSSGLFGRTALFLLPVLLAIGVLAGCSVDNADKTGAQENAPSTQRTDVDLVAWDGSATEPCADNQLSFVTGYQNFPGKQCAEIAEDVAATFASRVGYRKKCQALSGSSTRPSRVAGVRINECSPLRDEQGNYASMLVCCAADATAEAPAIIAYDVELDCPSDKTLALATGLHYPDKTCEQARVDVPAKLASVAYARACAAASTQSATPPKALDAAAFSCLPEAGAVVDVAVCCSSTLPPGTEQPSLVSKQDIWESLRTNSLFGLQLLLSLEPQRALEKGPGGESTLHLAGTAAIAELLLGHGASPDAIDDYGATPLHYAVRGRLTEVTTLLLARGATVDAMTDTQETALHFAPTRAIASLLLEHGANVAGAGIATPLHTAAFNGRARVAGLLLDQGADINAVDENGETPLHRAAFRNKDSIVRMLLQRGANPNIQSSGAKPRLPQDMTDSAAITALLAHSRNEKPEG